MATLERCSISGCSTFLSHGGLVMNMDADCMQIVIDDMARLSMKEAA